MFKNGSKFFSLGLVALLPAQMQVLRRNLLRRNLCYGTLQIGDGTVHHRSGRPTRISSIATDRLNCLVCVVHDLCVRFHALETCSQPTYLHNPHRQSCHLVVYAVLHHIALLM